MAESVLKLILDTVRKNIIPVIQAVQYDYNSRYINAVISTDGHKITVPAAAAVVLNATRADGASQAFSGYANDDGTVTVPVVQWITETAGDAVCNISVVSGEKKLSTTDFLIEVQEAPYINDISEDNPKYDLITEVLANENARIAEEGTRVTAEETRVANENIRVAGEENRVNSEIVRKSIFEGWTSDIAALPSYDSRISRNDKRITNLEQGVSESFETDAATAYIKNVPANVLPYAEITRIGGMSYAADGVIQNSAVTQIKSVGANFIPFPYSDISLNDEMYKELNGGAFRVDDDGGINVSGTPTSNSYIEIYNGIIPNNGETMTISISGAFSGVHARVTFYDVLGADQSVGYKNNIFDFFTSTPKTDYPTAKYMRITIYRNENGTEMSGKVYPMLNAGDSALPYTKYEQYNFDIPEEAQGLEGYGIGVNDTYNNHILYGGNNTVSWVRQTAEYIFTDSETIDFINQNQASLYIYAITPKENYRLAADTAAVFDTYTYKNNVLGVSAITNGTHPAGSAFLYYNTSNSIRRIYIVSDITTLDEFKASITGKKMIYILPEDEITDISDKITLDNFIRVVPNGNITAVNEYFQAVPTEITYQLKGSNAE